MQPIEFTYTKEDFLTPGPYEEVLGIEPAFERQLAIQALGEYARGLRVPGFKELLRAYGESHMEKEKRVWIDNRTDFTGQPLELDAGDWRAADDGVSRRTGLGTEVACPHPILPAERLVNIDTGTEKLKIAFCKDGRRWRSVIADKSVAASHQQILQLADQGIAVTSDSARALVKYLSDLESINYAAIPERKSVTRLGYLPGEGFSPYVADLIFDGDSSFRHVFESVGSHGSERSWRQTARSVRQGGVLARVVLAASFASALVQPCGALPFFVHLWGGESGTGKTVALMLAASVWGNPEMGRYIQTFNSTMVGRERLAAFLNHLPLVVDELQLARDGRGKLQFDVYSLAEGAGRTRGTRTGGIDLTPTWHNCILTSGETPITGLGSGAGAVNRVIEIECLSSMKIIEDGHGVSGAVRANYGFAGRRFVTKLYGGKSSLRRVRELYRTYMERLSGSDTTEKQAMAAAVILTADALSTEWIFRDGRALTVEEIAPFLATKAAVSAGERGYRHLCGWVAQNVNKFSPDAPEVYGLILENDPDCPKDSQYAFINSTIFRRACDEAGFPAPVLLSWLKERELILTRGRNSTRGKRLGGVNTECVVMRLPQEELGGWQEVRDTRGLPFS